MMPWPIALWLLLGTASLFCTAVYDRGHVTPRKVLVAYAAAPVVMPIAFVLLLFHLRKLP